MTDLHDDHLDRTLGEVIAQHAARTPERLAFITGGERWSWARYHQRASALGAAMASTGLAHGERIAIVLPDGPLVHAAYVGAERAGLVAVGIGPRAGRREIEHLLEVSQAKALLSLAHHREHDMAAVAAGEDVGRGRLTHLVVHVDDDAVTLDGQELGEMGPAAVARLLEGRGITTDELSFLNSTSGTTGMPKCVMHNQRRWISFNDLATDAGELSSDDTFMTAISAPFGFGIWTGHFTPTLLGAPTVLLERFSADATLEAIERERVTVLAAVSTQFIMCLNSPHIDERDLSSLRVLFTGGEAVPTDRAARFEDRTGAVVLQFFGSNETGALSCTTTRDGREQRLTTAGKVIPSMNVRLLDDDGANITASGGPGQPACRGPVTCLGYYRDEAANAELFTPDGWMTTGDIATISDGYLRVVGRKSDFIIRGGKNISAVAVEEELMTHPDVEMAAAVAMPSEVLGEQVCAFVVGRSDLTLEELTDHLAQRGVSKESWPERLVLVDELPAASGGKVAKAALRQRVAELVAQEREGSREPA